MRQSLWNKRIPTFLGLLLLGVSVAGLTYMTQSPQLFELGARSAVRFENIRVSNQTPTSLSISFRTEQETAVQLRIGQSMDSAQTLFDDRDEIGGQTHMYRTHHFTIKNLNAGTQYFFTMLAAGKTFDNQGQPFLAKTPSATENASESSFDLEPIKGTILTANGEDAKDALIYAKIEGTSYISTVSKAGSFLMPLVNLYAEDLTGFYTFHGVEMITIEVFGNDGSISIVKVPFNSHNDLPSITLGKNLDLTVQPLPTLSAGAQASDIDSSGFSKTDVSEEHSQKNEQTILNPKEGDFLLDPRPLIQGKGSPSQKIEVTVESEPQTSQLTIDETGEWSYQPDKPLPPGKHTISVRFFDGDKITKVVRQDFEVLASGSQVSESATPSPTMVLSPIPTPEPTAQPMPKTATILPSVLFIGAGALLTVVGFFAFNIFP